MTTASGIVDNRKRKADSPQIDTPAATTSKGPEQRQDTGQREEIPSTSRSNDIVLNSQTTRTVVTIETPERNTLGVDGITLPSKSKKSRKRGPKTRVQPKRSK